MLNRCFAHVYLIDPLLNVQSVVIRNYIKVNNKFQLPITQVHAGPNVQFYFPVEDVAMVTLAVL